MVFPSDPALHVVRTCVWAESCLSGSLETCCLMGPTSSPPGVRLQLKDSAPALGTQHYLRWVTQGPDWGGGAVESTMVATHPDTFSKLRKLTSSPPSACCLSWKGERGVSSPSNRKLTRHKVHSVGTQTHKDDLSKT